MKILVSVLVFLALAVALLLALPFLIDLNPLAARYKPQIESALGRAVDFTEIRLTLWPRLGARLSGVTVMDDPAFLAAPFALLSALDIGVQLRPLLSGRIVVDEIALRDPVITIVKNAQGLLNVSTLGAAGSPPSATVDGPASPSGSSGNPLRLLALLAVDRVSLAGGRLTYRDLSSRTPTEYTLQDLHIVLQQVHLGATPSLTLRTVLQPYDLVVTLDGAAGPLTESGDLDNVAARIGIGKIEAKVEGRLTNGRADFTVAAPSIAAGDVPLDLGLERPLLVKDFTAHIVSPYPSPPGRGAMDMMTVDPLSLALVMGGSTLFLTGSLRAGELTIDGASPVLHSVDVPVGMGALAAPVHLERVRARVQVNLSANAVDTRLRIPTFDCQVWGGRVTAAGSLAMHEIPAPFIGRLTVRDLQVASLMLMLGAKGVRVSGTAAADLALRGRGTTMPELTRSLVGTGRLSVADGTLEGVDLAQEALLLLKVLGVSASQLRGTAFSSLEGAWAIANGVAELERFQIESQEARVKARGTIGFDQTVNLHAQVALSETLSAKVAVSPVLRLASRGGQVTVPILIRGTMTAPSYTLDTAAIAGSVQEQLKDRVGLAAEKVLKGKAGARVQQGMDALKRLFGE